MGAASFRNEIGEAVSIQNLISTIAGAYSTNASDEHKNSNSGYSGWDTNESTKNWKEENDGFIKSLKKIAEKDSSLKSESERMIAEYKQLMESVNFNTNVLKEVLVRPSWKGAESFKGTKGSVLDKENQKGQDFLTQAKQAEYLMHVLPKIEEAFRNIHCSVVTEDEKTSEEMRKDFMDRWDYKSGQKCPDGIKRKRTYTKGNKFGNAERRALFNSRFFKVNNSNMQEYFNNYKNKLSSSEKGIQKRWSCSQPCHMLLVQVFWDELEDG